MFKLKIHVPISGLQVKSSAGLVPVIFYKESFVYPFVNFEWKGEKIFLSNNSFCDVLRYIESCKWQLSGFIV